MTESAFEELHIVVCALDRLIDDALSRLAAMEAFEITSKECVIPDPTLDYLTISSSAIKDSVTLAVAAIFEKDKTCGYTNCSLGEVKNLLVNDIDFHLSASSRTELNESISKLMEQYQNSGIYEQRNKTKAHYDLTEFFVQEYRDPSIEELKSLLFGARAIMNDFFNKWLGVTVIWEDYADRVFRYKQSLLSCING